MFWCDKLSHKLEDNFRVDLKESGFMLCKEWWAFVNSVMNLRDSDEMGD